METFIKEAAIVGICATSLMTFFFFFFCAISKKRLQVIQILGTMLTNQTTKNKGLSVTLGAFLLGTITHYLVGFGFAWIYIWLCAQGIFNFDFPNSVTYGALIGVFAVLVWWLFIKIHPNPPSIPVYYYLPCIFLSHLVFGIGMKWTFFVLFEKMNSL